MGSVQDFGECPKCKFEHAMYELYYKINEEVLFCGRCGYHMRSNPTESEISGGFGAYRVVYKDGGGVIGSFYDEDGLQEFLEEFLEHGMASKSGEKPIVVSHTFQEDGEWLEKDIITNEVESFSNYLFGEDE